MATGQSPIPTRCDVQGGTPSSRGASQPTAAAATASNAVKAIGRTITDCQSTGLADSTRSARKPLTVASPTAILASHVCDEVNNLVRVEADLSAYAYFDHHRISHIPACIEVQRRRIGSRCAAWPDRDKAGPLGSGGGYRHHNGKRVISNREQERPRIDPIVHLQLGDASSGPDAAPCTRVKNSRWL
jgi:hypothetical protein